MNNLHISNIQLEPIDHHRLASLCGHQDENLRQLEKKFSVEINNRGNQFQITGEQPSVKKTEGILTELYQQTETEKYLTPDKIHLLLKEFDGQPSNEKKNAMKQQNQTQIEIHTKAGFIRGRTANQKLYLKNINEYDINFAIGPAGTGKSYLAVASAIAALEKNEVQRILLVRPAVEAGEKLGFLPGGLEEKVEPYLRPLYDALFEMLGFDKVGKLIQQNIIEVAPLAYMRGRTLNDAFVILDESQNTTIEQMKMFLTRIGFGSKAIITGDITQIDLPKGKKSGLKEALDVLKPIPGICFTLFESKDVVRHPLVQQIIEAYESHESNKERDRDASN